MERITPGIVLKQEDRGEFDKLVTLLTPQGVIPVMMKGVKKSKAKLRFGALPFAFAEYTLSGRGGLPTVTGCMQIEDLSKITADVDLYYAATLISEVALRANLGGEVFFELLKTLKAMLYGEVGPIPGAIHFCQYVIHNSGYGYDYSVEPSEVKRPIDLLYYTLELSRLSTYDLADDELMRRTLAAITKNFEDKFDCVLLSKSFLQ